MDQLNDESFNKIKREVLVMFVLRILIFVVFVVLMVVFVGCGNFCLDGDFKMFFIENDYCVCYFIKMVEVEYLIDILVVMGDVKFGCGIEDIVCGFGQNYKNNFFGVLQIVVLLGLINVVVVCVVVLQVCKQLFFEGVEQCCIIVISYQVELGVFVFIKFSFVVLIVMIDQCGQWLEDLMENFFGNKNWYNFGCLNQNNLVVQVVNLKDLFDLCVMIFIDVQCCVNVIDNYCMIGFDFGKDMSIIILS